MKDYALYERKGKFFSTILICVHAPTEEKDDEQKRYLL
jgi:hypothetical protein